MANRFWIGTGDWNGSNTANWSTTSGGSGGASVPNSTDDAIFNAASGSGTCTKTANTNVKSVNFTGFTGTFAGSSAILLYGDITFGSTMNLTYTGTLQSQSAVDVNVRTNGKTVLSNFNLTQGAHVKLQDEYVSTGNLVIFTSNPVTFSTNNHNLTVNTCSFSNGGTEMRTFNFGTSLVHITNRILTNNSSSANLTFNVSNCEIIFSNAGLGPQFLPNTTFKKISYTSQPWANFGPSVFTVDELYIESDSLRFDNGASVTILSSFDFLNNTIIGSSGTATISKASGLIEIENGFIQNIAATGGATFNAINSTDAGGNTGWNFINTNTGNFLAFM